MIAIIAFVIGFVLLLIGGSAIDSFSIIPIIVCAIGLALMAPLVVYSRRFENDKQI